MKYLLISLILGYVCPLCAQQELKKDSIALSGFVEAYYSYDFNRPEANTRPPFVYSHNRHNEFNLNLGYLKVNYAGARTRANLALAAGTYVHANYAAEPGVLRNIFEANLGIKLTTKRDLWLDAGIMPSHIGFESARSTDCWTLTRSLIAENSPYFQGGAKLTYLTSNKHWLISLLALNGWQRIQRVDGNSLVSWGMQLQFNPSEKILINYSNFLGTDQPDSSRRFRHFHNIYITAQPGEKLGLTLGFDIGQEQKIKGSNEYATWYGAVAIARYKTGRSSSVAGRIEYYCDRHNVLIPLSTGTGFRMSGVSINLDKLIGEHFLWRTEFRLLRSPDKLFTRKTIATQNNFAISTSWALNF